MATLSEAIAHAVGLIETGRPDAAAVILSRVLAVQPDHADALNLMGVCAGWAGATACAAARIRWAFAMMPGSLVLRNNLTAAYVLSGTAHQGAGSFTDAAADFRQALALHPLDAAVWGNLAVMLLADGKTAEADVALRRMIVVQPESDWAWSKLARLPGSFTGSFALLLSGELEEGWREYEWRRRQFPDDFPNSTAHSGMGRISPARPSFCIPNRESAT